MRIDGTHRKWLVFSAILTLVSVAIYVYSRHAGTDSPSGLTGLIFGSVGFAFILFAGALAIRKRFRSFRWGETKFWMRGHLWLGALSLLLVWFHGGFHHGGPLTSMLMYLLYAVAITGIAGAFLQHYLPRKITKLVQAETVRQHIPDALRELAAEADEFAAALAGPTNGDSLESWQQEQRKRAKARYGRRMEQIHRGKVLIEAIDGAPMRETSEILKFYELEIKPYLRGSNPGSPLADVQKQKIVFDSQKSPSRSELNPAIDHLKGICDEFRQLRLQRRMNWILNFWLLIHVPISLALIVLATVHAVIALRYSLQ